MRIPRLTGVLFALMLPVAVHAATVTDWSFLMGDVPGEWQVQRLSSILPGEFGTRVRTNTDGFMYREVTLAHAVDTLRLTVAAAAEVHAVLLWHTPDMPESDFIQMPFTIPASPAATTVVTLLPVRYVQWSNSVDRIGIWFPAGSDVLLQDISLEGRGFFAQAWQGFLSFWRFDDFRLYSINFLWGPLIVLSPAARAELFQQLPPFGRSGAYALYVLPVLALFPIIWMIVRRKGQAAVLRATAWCLAAFMVSWIIFDLRMSVEMLSYAKDDWQHWVLPPLQEKTFRTYGSFDAVVLEVLPELQAEEKYAVFPEAYGAYMSHLRYLTYPSLPMEENEDLSGIKLYFVYARPDIRVDAEQRLVNASGKILTTPGDIVKQFAKGTFLFRVRE